MRIGLLILLILAVIFVAGFLLGRGFLASDSGRERCSHPSGLRGFRHLRLSQRLPSDCKLGRLFLDIRTVSLISETNQFIR